MFLSCHMHNFRVESQRTPCSKQAQNLKTSDFAPASTKDFLDIQATIECGFTLKHLHDMTKTYSQMHHTDKYSQHSSIIWPVWLNSWVFVYELSGCGFFKSSCSHIFLKIGIHFMEDWTATTRHGVTKKWSTKTFRLPGNLLRKNLQLKDVY